MATEDNFLQSYDLDEANKLLESSPEPADRVLDEEAPQDPSVAEAVPDGQALPYPEDTDVEMKAESPEGAEVDLGLSRFGPDYLKALRRLLNSHEPFLGPDRTSTKPMFWSQSMKLEKYNQFREASRIAIDEMMVAIYKDRNILFRDAPDSGPVADPLPPTVGERVAHQASIARPTLRSIERYLRAP